MIDPAPADTFRVLVGFIKNLIMLDPFEVSETVAWQFTTSHPSDRAKAKHLTRRLLKLAKRQSDEEPVEMRDHQAAAVADFARFLSASTDPQKSYVQAARCRDVDLPVFHMEYDREHYVGHLYYLDEFVEMVEEGSIRPTDGVIGSTNLDEEDFNWENPRTQMKNVDEPETAVIEWCNK